MTATICAYIASMTDRFALDEYKPICQRNSWQKKPAT
jgi:dGTP triphosphohydrolase